MALTEIPIELSSTPSIVDNGNATAITIGSDESATFSGSVGIGGSTITDVNLLNIQGSGASKNIGVVFNDTNTSKIFAIQNGGSALKFFDYTASAERMRIDGGTGNLLVGTTTTNIATEGTVIYGSGNEGVMTLSSTNMTALYVNRSNGGELAQFRTGGSTIVGSIGSSANDLFIASSASGHNGLRFHVNGILPTNNAGAIVDADADLGDPSYRFKDLYLSGGAFLGGTGAANKLEDYEEGTWTPTDGSGASLTLGATNNRYTKVGRLVVASVRLTFPTTSSTTTAQVVLPFTVDSNAISSVSGGVCTEQNYDADITLTAAINDNTRVIFRKRGVSGLTNANLSGKILRFTVTYHAA